MTDLQPCDVEIRVAADGGVAPLRFTWAGGWLAVAQIGRAWSDGSGDHWLVMPASGQVFELVRAPDGRWRSAPQTPRPRVA